MINTLYCFYNFDALHILFVKSLYINKIYQKIELNKGAKNKKSTHQAPIFDPEPTGEVNYQILIFIPNDPKEFSACLTEGGSENSEGKN